MFFLFIDDNRISCSIPLTIPTPFHDSCPLPSAIVTRWPVVAAHVFESKFVDIYFLAVYTQDVCIVI